MGTFKFKKRPPLNAVRDTSHCVRRLPGPTDAARTGTMPVVNNRKAPKRRAAGGALDRELKRQHSELFSAEMSQRVADREAGVARPMYFAKVNQEREARFAHMAEEAGWYGQRLWRRGWEGMPWHRDYMAAGLRDRPGSRIYVDFRKEFRISVPMFDDLVEELRDANLPWARDEKIPMSGAHPIPLALKVMSALRVLAVGIPFGALVHHGLSESTVRVFFLNFVHWMRDTVYAREVRIPDAEQLKEHERVFANCGYPGASPPLTTSPSLCHLHPRFSPLQAPHLTSFLSVRYL